MPNDSLFRISFKCIILNELNEVLVVKERGRTSWDLPGGGIDYGESIKESIARELFEEVSFRGDFEYRIVTMTDPEKLATRDLWQTRVILRLIADDFSIAAGNDTDEIAFIDTETLRTSDQESERRIYDYAQLASK